MRTTPEENAQLGKIIAGKLYLSTAPVAVVLPLKGISVISAPGQKFHDPAADEALFQSLKASLRKDIEVIEVDCAINDLEFSEVCARKLLKQIKFLFDTPYS